MKAVSDRLGGGLKQISSLTRLARLVANNYPDDFGDIDEVLTDVKHIAERDAIRDTRPVKTTGKRTLLGIVTRDKSNETRRVEVEHLVRHPRYGKFIKKRTVCYAHDDKNESHLGDTVEILESRPLSKLKRWVMVKCAELNCGRTRCRIPGV